MILDILGYFSTYHHRRRQISRASSEESNRQKHPQQILSFSIGQRISRVCHIRKCLEDIRPDDLRSVYNSEIVGAVATAAIIFLYQLYYGILIVSSVRGGHLFDSSRVFWICISKHIYTTPCALV